MRFYADLHIHSKYSRATSKDCDLEHLTLWGRKKGITVIGTGDFTHPAWIKEIKEKLVPAEPGLFRLREDLEKKILEQVPRSCRGVTRFMLSVEISTIYKKGDRTRKIHHLIYAPTIEQAEKINQKLAKIGNIRSDGRPILGLDSRHLLEIVLEAGKDCYLVPAHIWTPWFAVLGSKSGFDAVADCYADLADHVFAVETGLSSDPEMNWRVSGLDRYRLMSNSDAHSPQKLGREVSAFNTPLDYFEMKKALETGKGYEGTKEFFPEEGKYHLDGHRKCSVRLEPGESRSHQGLCPKCEKPLTLGVLYRVEELADRKQGEKPKDAAGYQNLIPLPEVLSEIAGVGPSSQAVQRDYERLLAELGPELFILSEMPLERIRSNVGAGSPRPTLGRGDRAPTLLTEAISRMREGKVIREAGYDGEYGVIRLFKEGELKDRGSAGVLFEMGEVEQSAEGKGQSVEDAKSEGLFPSSVNVIPARFRRESKRIDPRQKHSGMTTIEATPLVSLDTDQQKAVEAVHGPLLIVAGPGSGKTRTLTHRVAGLIQNHGAKPEECLTITFTRRAAEEMRSRLEKLLPEMWVRIPVLTFHALGLKIIQENVATLGLPENFQIVGAGSPRPWRGSPEAARPEAKGEETSPLQLTYDDLIRLPVELLEKNPELCERYRKRWRWISIDEYQDIDELQYRLVRLLVGKDQNLCVIGDPDQAIYSFRGARVEFFLRFEQDFIGADKIHLTRNYRSGETIVSASTQMIEPATLVENYPAVVAQSGVGAIHELPLHADPGRVTIHQARTDKAEAEFVVHTLEKLIGGTTFFSLDTERSEGTAERDYSFSDFAVLYRTEAQAALLEEAFQRSGIPFQRNSHSRLIDDPEVRKLLNDAGAGSPRPEAKGEETSPLQQIQNPTTLEKLSTLLARVKGDWKQFLSEIQLGVDVDAWDERAQRVSLMTLHAAKGLEFPVVFITGCEDGILPFRWGNKNVGAGSPRPEAKGEGTSPLQETTAEERRIFYVGMTRAKERLFLSHAAKRFWRGKPREQSPSPFLKDIEERLLERSESLYRSRKSAEKNLQMDLF